jgi:NADH dehydrogenase (ubiquinone) flavoprotein 2
MKQAQEIISHYPPQYKKAAVIPLLDLGQRQNSGWTSISVMNYVAELLEMVSRFGLLQGEEETSYAHRV